MREGGKSGGREGGFFAFFKPSKKVPTGKKVAPNPAAPKGVKKSEKQEKNPLFESRKKNFGIGGGQFRTRDLTRFVKWPKYVRLQRQRRVLLQRLKVPPAIAQFSRTVDKNGATQLFKLLHKYRPETSLAKHQRLQAAAAAKKDGKDAATKAPTAVKFGISEVVNSIEKKTAKLVVIAHDVEPVEITVWLPALCRKMDVPYVIVKSKSRLGAVVHQKTVTALALTDVSKEDKNELTTLAGLFTEQFNKNVDARRTWGGGLLGPKSLAQQKKREKAVAKEASAKMDV
ncbi:60S ribosomal protein L7a [Planoprotostelium fungivorum]|uniref:60S ribosomal protein L7a n=1 Tax=Planoprotostelium fungivorum TaxID=1890364 RepID=A0A2P6NAY6_9EUKA|nr:60S ribosomal protein L7a [Planoprotostelium fungivorum]